MGHNKYEFVTIEQARKNEEQRQKKLKEMSESVAGVAEKLKERGYDFEIRETGQEFIVSVGGSEHHFFKNDPFPLEHETKNGKVRKYPSIQDVIKARIVNPGGGLAETIYSEDFKNL